MTYPEWDLDFKSEAKKAQGAWVNYNNKGMASIVRQ